MKFSPFVITIIGMLITLSLSPAWADTPITNAVDSESGLSSFFTLRKIAGFVLLIALFVWMVWNQKRHENKTSEPEQKSEEFTDTGLDIKSDTSDKSNNDRP